VNKYFEILRHRIPFQKHVLLGGRLDTQDKNKKNHISEVADYGGSNLLRI